MRGVQNLYKNTERRRAEHLNQERNTQTHDSPRLDPQGQVDQRRSSADADSGGGRSQLQANGLVEKEIESLDELPVHQTHSVDP